MNKHLLKGGASTQNSLSLGTVTRHMVRERAVALANLNGRSAQEVAKSDWEQAKRELTGHPDANANEALRESASEAERRNPLPDSAGHKTPVAPSEDEDEEGRSDNARLVQEGIAGAEQDQMRQASLKRNN